MDYDTIKREEKKSNLVLGCLTPLTLFLGGSIIGWYIGGWLHPVIFSQCDPIEAMRLTGGGCDLYLLMNATMFKWTGLFLGMATGLVSGLYLIFISEISR